MNRLRVVAAKAAVLASWIAVVVVGDHLIQSCSAQLTVAAVTTVPMAWALYRAGALGSRSKDGAVRCRAPGR